MFGTTKLGVMTVVCRKRLKGKGAVNVRNAAKLMGGRKEVEQVTTCGRREVGSNREGTLQKQNTWR